MATTAALSEKQKQILRDFAATEDASVLPQSKRFFDKIRDKLRGES